MPTVSVVVNKSYKTDALLDSGSTNSFITSDAVTSLGLSSKTVVSKRSTVDNPCMATSTKVVNFILYSLDSSTSLTMSNVFAPDNCFMCYFHSKMLLFDLGTFFTGPKIICLN